MDKYSRVKIKIEGGEVVEFEDVIFDSGSTHSVFIMSDRTFSVATAKVIWVMFTR